jgi:Cd2+/Zn2+-exporting ATPase
MPKKIYTIENLDCAHCAARAEEKIRQVPGVQEVSVVFTAMQLHLTAEDPDAVLPLAEAAARQVEADIRFLPQTETHGCHGHEHSCCHGHDHCSCGHDHSHCGCGHDHGHRDCGHDHGHCDCGHDHAGHKEKSELPGILAGGGLFIAGLVLAALLPPFHIPVFLAAWLLLGWDVLKNAGKNLIRGKMLDENFLMSLATVGALILGEFPEAVGIMLFYRIGEFFEHKAVERSRSRIMEAVDLRPEEVHLLTSDGIQIIPASEARVGDLLQVRPGDRIPLDGVVVEGNSRIDTSPITGESVPVGVHPGETVTSGCINGDGLLVIRAEKPLADSMVTRILNSVENAAAGKPKIDRFITRFARIYTPIVVAIAAAVAILPPLFTGQWSYWIYTALSFLVMSCPCALVLSVPLAFFSGIGAGSRKGILFKDGASMEALAAVKTAALDKTGTITKGNFSVQNTALDPAIFRLCAGAESASTHPVATSIVAEAKTMGLSIPQPEELEEIPGHGVRAVVEEQTILCGNRKLMDRHGITVPEGTHADGVEIFVAVDGSFTGTIHISDALREDAAEAVARLKAMNIHPAMLTGDAENSARAVATAAGIEDVHSRLLPEDKLSVLTGLRREHGSVLFVGDGINDAPVLSGADVGAAMGSGADAAIEAADVVIMTNKTQAIPDAISLARATQTVAWQNVVFALCVKLIVMILGLLGHASMWAAVFADSGVAMLCVLNSIRMLYTKK